MILLLLVIGAVILGLLLLAVALRPVRSGFSPYELRRRQEAGDRAAAAAVRREELLTQMETLRRPVTSLLLVLLTLVLIAALGWLWGAALAAIISLVYARAENVALLRRQAHKLYRSRQKTVLGTMARHKKALEFLTGKARPEPITTALGSREELIHLITDSGAILSPDDKKLLTHALVFTQRRASEVMTRREDIVSVDHTELLGPLVLSDLHKTGHSCFPVVARDLDHVVGMLDIRSMLTLEAKRSVTAAKAMTGHAFYIRGDQTLDHALAAYVRTRHHLLVVIDEEGATLGLLSLRDVLEALFGHRIADEFASDSDVRLVATREL